MSISYMFVEKQRELDLAELQAMLKKERETIVAKLSEFTKTHPALEGPVEDAIFELEHCLAFRSLDRYQDEHVIGVSTATQFHWRDENGFGRIQDVEKFLEEHPGFVIQNECEADVALSDFKTMLKKYS